MRGWKTGSGGGGKGIRVKKQGEEGGVGDKKEKGEET